MKYSIFVFVVCVATSSSVSAHRQEYSSDHGNNYTSLAPPSLTYQLGDVLKVPITNAVEAVLQFVGSELILLVPLSTEVSVASLLAALKDLPNPNVGTVCAKVLKVAGIALDQPNVVQLLGTFPPPFADTTVDVADFIDFIFSETPKIAKTVKFGTLLAIKRLYFSKIVPCTLIDLMNNLE